MIEFAITKVSTIMEYTGSMPGELRMQLASNLPKQAIRKFSDSGLQVFSIMRELAVEHDETVVSVSTFAESVSLEEFIDSFPTSSPARFQRSVHPSAVQQARVISNSPLRTYLPMAGKEGIAVAAVRTALSLDGRARHLVGCEECGTWSVGIKAGSDTGFAFGLKLEPMDSAPTVLGTISWSPESSAGASCDTSLITLHRAIRERKTYSAASPDMGAIAIKWK